MKDKWNTHCIPMASERYAPKAGEKMYPSDQEAERMVKVNVIFSFSAEDAMYALKAG